MTSHPSAGQSAEQAVDLTNCDREPIHLLGRVQSYGALLALSSDWLVQHASDNLPAVLGFEVEEALGRPLSELIVSDAMDRIRRNMGALEGRDGAVRLFGIVLRGQDKLFDVSVHQSGRHLIIEFEPKAGPREADVMSEVYPCLNRLKGLNELPDLAREAARGLRMLSGFDSVMVYQFQPDKSGRVIAEDRADGQSRYMGLNFPASDIPAQARELYRRSLLRLIADVEDDGSMIEPQLSLDGSPIDLSLAVTRAVSPIHIEYLKNMGVGASMSVSILRNGELWGLFACHHDSSRYIDYERRTAIEMFGHMFSYEISRQEESFRLKAQDESGRMQTALMANLAEGRGLSETLFSVSRDIGRSVSHDGMVLYLDETFTATGSVPTEEEFRKIARMLDTRAGPSVFASDSLSRLLPDARDYMNRASGMLAIPISRRPRDYLILFRKPIASKVNWAGDPAKPATLGPNGTRLTPRKSFEVWTETVEGRSAPWSVQDNHVAERLRIVLLEIFLKITDAANGERKRAQEQQQLLISELNHRVRNILNLMRGLVSQSSSGARSLTDFTDSLDGRIQSLARAHDQLTSEKWEPSSLKALIHCEFEAYAQAKSARVLIDGPDAMISPAAYTTMALVLHEMATNSLKYGALCDQAGRVEISLRQDRSGGLNIDWVEKGGPPVRPPSRRGFGTTILERSIPHELQGDAEVSYKTTGVEAHFRIPPRHIDRIRREDDDSRDATPQPALSNMIRLSGNGLVLEDALIIAMDAAAMLEEMGASKVAIASSVEQAMQEIDRDPPAFALLDINLGAEQSVTVAERLHALGIPFVLATGYGETSEIVESYPPARMVQKPFSIETLAVAFSAGPD
ncbi:histidine kinase [Oceanicola sp. 22II-s10i]|uniref:HWE histidine kinase domain-containing protein n=1 Tax=Oceanicola sp. 22II-s10i TaxID=1317116 RepID=UPI000B5291A6|nr:HWE histidine kinase domain-containing protein [Oceanicola sp. 22II-s10i]OWU83977.1 histidine kinase [Oceanicola sp. 22II-s10i]